MFILLQMYYDPTNGEDDSKTGNPAVIEGVSETDEFEEVH